MSGDHSPIASGINHCTWLMVGAHRRPARSRRKAEFILLDPTNIRSSDTWFTTGMRGTGSNTAV